MDLVQSSVEGHELSEEIEITTEILTSDLQSPAELTSKTADQLNQDKSGGQTTGSEINVRTQEKDGENFEDPFSYYSVVFCDGEKDSFSPSNERTMHYKCTQCQFMTSKMYFFRVHALTHCKPSSNQHFKCPDCEYVTKHKFNLKTHFKRHIDINELDEHEIFRCSNCDYKSYNKQDLQTHEKKHDGQKPFKCELCEFNTIYKHSLIHHMDSKHAKRRPFKCTLCPYSASRKQDLTTHVFKHSKAKPFNCDQCDFSTAYKQTYKSHMNMHAGRRNFKCPHQDCTFAATNQSNLKAHLITHNEVKPFKCSVCDYSTTQKHNLQVHRVRKHMGPIPDAAVSKHFKCDRCYFMTAQKFSLKRHMERHKPDRKKPEKSFECKTCGYKTGYKHSLRRHLAKHSSVKPFKCGYCDYSAINMSQMHVHIAKHTGVKPFKCLQCDYATANKQHLLAHGAKHTNLRLKCSICNFMSAWKSRMRIHMKTHTEEEKTVAQQAAQDASRVYRLLSVDGELCRVSFAVKTAIQENDPNVASAVTAALDHSYVFSSVAEEEYSEESSSLNDVINESNMSSMNEASNSRDQNLTQKDIYWQGDSGMIMIIDNQLSEQLKAGGEEALQVVVNLCSSEQLAHEEGEAVSETQIHGTKTPPVVQGKVTNEKTTRLRSRTAMLDRTKKVKSQLRRMSPRLKKRSTKS